ncbi:lasso peptide biosynthesis B2 protein [Blastococcus aurantiacus]|uniref:lasso peptide biosynthesis B2 protein n=1 Tax=Blastococcus aurantiacus TaxID=1550231 RepID=UPI000B8A054F
MTSSNYPSRLHGLDEWRAYRRAPLVGRYSVASARAGLWAWISLRRAARALARDGVRATVVAPPPLPSGARRGVEAVLRRTSPTCLERSLVLQSWLAHHDVPCEIIIGVAKDGPDVKAHAWLDIESGDHVARNYRELHRLEPR